MYKRDVYFGHYAYQVSLRAAFNFNRPVRTLFLRPLNPLTIIVIEIIIERMMIILWTAAKQSVDLRLGTSSGSFLSPKCFIFLNKEKGPESLRKNLINHIVLFIRKMINVKADKNNK